MRFTLVLDRKSEQGSSYELIFEPCPVWSRGKEMVLNLNPHNPHLQKGCVKRLFEVDSITDAGSAIVVVHDVGHGSAEDLDVLVDDLDALGLKYKVIKFGC